MVPTIKIDIERWKYNADYNIYVSNMGRVKTADKTLINKRVGKHTGYSVVPVTDISTGKQKCKSLHVLVMETWKPEGKGKGLTIDHLDQNRRNNRLDNLEWVSAAENQARATANCGDEDPEEIVQYLLKKVAELTYQVKELKADKENMAKKIKGSEQNSTKAMVKMNGKYVTKQEISIWLTTVSKDKRTEVANQIYKLAQSKKGIGRYSYNNVLFERIEA